MMSSQDDERFYDDMDDQNMVFSEIASNEVSVLACEQLSQMITFV